MPLLLRGGIVNRTFLYHNDYPQGRIFEDEVEYQAALDSGAVGSPAAVDYSETVEKEEVRPVVKRKRRTKAEIEADKVAVEAGKDGAKQ